eukprot:5024757-Pyramimonas_sp.AAC.1
MDYLQDAQRAEVSSMGGTTAEPNSEFNDDMGCAGAQRALQQMPLLDRLNAWALEIDADNVDDTWEAANMMPRGPTSMAPPYFQHCAADQVDPDSAGQLGATCRHLIGMLGTFYWN